MDDQDILVSIIICTRNRAYEIVNCFPDLVKQAASFSDVEVIVIDNGSTDNTKSVVDSASKNLDYPIRYFYEEVPGLCQARNRGRAEARGSVLAYLDDDSIVKAHWLERVRDHFIAKKSDCLGGKVSIELGGNMPFALENHMHWFFMASIHGDTPHMFKYPAHPTGCNMCISAYVFDKIGGFDTNLKLYGDEKDFFRRASEAGFTSFYDPSIEVYQFIPAERLTKDQLRIKSFKWGEGAAMNWMIERGSSLKRAGKITEYFIRSLYMGVLSTVRGNFSGFYTYWYNRGYLKNLLKGIETKKRYGS